MNREHAKEVGRMYHGGDGAGREDREGLMGRCEPGDGRSCSWLDLGQRRGR